MITTKEPVHLLVPQHQSKDLLIQRHIQDSNNHRPPQLPHETHLLSPASAGHPAHHHVVQPVVQRLPYPGHHQGAVLIKANEADLQPKDLSHAPGTR